MKLNFWQWLGIGLLVLGGYFALRSPSAPAPRPGPESSPQAAPQPSSLRATAAATTSAS